MNIFLIGNGFDLAHGLKTSYNHFLDFTIRKDRKTSNLYGVDSNGIYFKNELLLKIVDERNSKNWCDIESLYFELLKKDEDPQKLNQEFEEIKVALYNYLRTQEKLSKPIKGFLDIFTSLVRLNRNYVINFNYTNTLRHYKVNFDDIINIHGQLNDSINPPIFGYAANQKETLELLERNDDSYLTNIKQYEYLNTTNLEKLNSILQYNDEIKVFILGHSCGLSDQQILKTIFENDNIKMIYNFYYEIPVNHKIKLINLNRTTNEDIGFRKFKSFPKSLRMPQFDNDVTKEEIEAFFSANENLKSKFL